MDRHNTPFPHKEYLSMLSGAKDILPNRIEECWGNGIFDEYSDKHFLIRAIENDTEFFKKYFVEHHLAHHFHFNHETFPVNFLMNLNSRLNFLYSCFGQSKIEKFLKDQLSAGKQNYTQNTFFEALSELHLLSHFAAFGPSALLQAYYEPPIGPHGSNPEARFEYENGMILDIEVKTPNFLPRSNNINFILPCLLISEEGREKLKEYCQQHGIECRFPRVKKLSDFFVSAEKKFTIPASKNHINLLAINWTYADTDEVGLFEPTKLLCNQINGIFFDKSFAAQIGITGNALKKITAVFLYRISEEALLFSDLRYLFQTRDYRIIMNPYVEHGDAQCVHDLTSMAVNLPCELDDARSVYISLESTEWLNQSRDILSIMDTYLIRKA